MEHNSLGVVRTKTMKELNDGMFVRAFRVAFATYYRYYAAAKYTLMVLLALATFPLRKKKKAISLLTTISFPLAAITVYA